MRCGAAAVSVHRTWRGAGPGGTFCLTSDETLPAMRTNTEEESVSCVRAERGPSPTALLLQGVLARVRAQCRLHARQAVARSHALGKHAQALTQLMLGWDTPVKSCIACRSKDSPPQSEGAPKTALLASDHHALPTLAIASASGVRRASPAVAASGAAREWFGVKCGRDKPTAYQFVSRWTVTCGLV